MKKSGWATDLENDQELAESELRNSSRNRTFTVHLTQESYCLGKTDRWGKLGCSIHWPFKWIDASAYTPKGY